ncbi:GerAB/ArcD/ProY family transporter [Paenibacillus rigui]|uniref:Spore gernimation protein n=1 Tax=Paenibacillus rigui TaxID=554312 RepID=A0A229UUA5_9BACL|nr:endospore germination permease [Paenibacillus rigui]OXM86964.1 spore gernimation protein [Paenibacillus rigui]
MIEKKISSYQLAMIVILSSGLLNHVTVIPILLDTSGKDGWITVSLACISSFLWFPIVLYILKRMNGLSLLSWLRLHFKGWSWFVLVPLLLIVYGTGATTLKETAQWAKINYLPNTPMLVIVLALLLLCMKSVNLGLKALALSSGILLPFVVLFGFFVMSGNIPHKDYTLLRPVLLHGWSPVLHGFIYAVSGLSELFLIVLVQHRVSDKISYSFFLTLSVMIAILTIGPLTGSIAEFGVQEAAKQRYPAYEQWRILQLSRFIEHMDFLSIFQWLSGAFIRIALSIWMLTECLHEIIKGQRRIIVWLSGAAIGLFGIFPLSDNAFITLMSEYYIPAFVLCIAALSFILWGRSLFINKEGRAT